MLGKICGWAAIALVGAIAVTSCGPRLDVPVETNVGQLSSLGRDYLLGPGDEIEIAVFDNEDLSVNERVPVGGVIGMPLIGGIMVAGRTVDSLAAEVTDRLRTGFLVNPRVTVRIVEYRPIYVLGGVKSPGIVRYAPGITVIEAIAASGGHSDDALRNKAPIVIRSNDPTKTQRFVALTSILFPGDILEIPSTHTQIFPPTVPD